MSQFFASGGQSIGVSYAEYIMQNAGLDEAQARIKLVLEKSLEIPWDNKGNQSWVFIRRTDVEAETPILWPPDAKNWLIGKDPDARKDWRQEEEGMTEDEMIGWHHWLNGHEFEQALEVGGG